MSASSSSSSSSSSAPYLKSGDSLSSPGEARKTNTFFRRGRRSGRSRTQQGGVFSQFPEVIKATPSAASSSSASSRDPLEAMRCEIKRKDETIQRLVNAAIDANGAINKKEHLTHKQIEDVQRILDLEVLLEGQAKKSPAVKVKKTERNVEFVESDAAKLYSGLQQLVIETTRLRDALQEDSCNRIEMKQRLKDCTSQLETLQDQTAMLIPSIKNKIKSLNSKITVDHRQRIDPESFDAISKYERKPIGLIEEEVARRKAITSSRINRKDELTKMLHQIESVEEILVWHIDDIFTDLCLLKAMEDHKEQLLSICNFKRRIVSDFKAGDDDYRQGLQKLSSQLNVIDRKLNYSEDLSSETFLQIVAQKIESYQADLDKFTHAREEDADLVEERLKGIEIADSELCAVVSQDVATNMLAIRAEKEKTLNSLKALHARLLLAQEEAKWSVDSMRIFGAHLAKTEEISSRVGKLKQDLEDSKEEVRTVSKGRGEYKNEKFQRQLSSYIEIYKVIAEDAKNLYDELQKELAILVEKIDIKEDPAHLAEHIARVTITDPDLLSTTKEDIVDFYRRMITLYKANKHEAEAKWKGVVETIHTTLPMAIDRHGYVLRSEGSANWLTSDPYPKEALRGKTWFPEQLVQSPFATVIGDGAASSSSSQAVKD